MAGAIGYARFGFDVWGDTVSTGSRIARAAEPGGVKATELAYAAVRDTYRVERREGVFVKGKGVMTTYAVLGPEARAGVAVRTATDQPTAGSE